MQLKSKNGFVQCVEKVVKPPTYSNIQINEGIGENENRVFYFMEK